MSGHDDGHGHSQTTMIGLLLSSLAMDIEIKHAIDAVRTDLREVDVRLSAEIQQVDDDIRIIAEGLMSLDAKVEGMRST